MKLLIYYSHNHKCYKTKFDYGFGKKIGDVNGYNEELMAIVPLRPPRGQPLRAQSIKFLEKVIDRLKYGKRNKTVYIEKEIHRYPWWKY